MIADSRFSMAQVIELNDDNFEQMVLKSSLPVLVDFCAERCTPCRMLAPIVEKLAGEYDGRITFSKLNVEQGRNAATRYGVRSIPTLLFFSGGKPMRQFVGFTSEKDLKRNLDEALQG